MHLYRWTPELQPVIQLLQLLAFESDVFRHLPSQAMHHTGRFSPSVHGLVISLGHRAQSVLINWPYFCGVDKTSAAVSKDVALLGIHVSRQQAIYLQGFYQSCSSTLSPVWFLVNAASLPISCRVGFNGTSDKELH